MTTYLYTRAHAYTHVAVIVSGVCWTLCCLRNRKLKERAHSLSPNSRSSDVNTKVCGAYQGVVVLTTCICKSVVIASAPTIIMPFPIMLIFGPIMLFFFAAFLINYASKRTNYASNVSNYSYI